MYAVALLGGSIHVNADGRATEQGIDPHVVSANSMPERDALLRNAERALIRGDTAAAVSALEQAATMRHAADTEMGLVRAAMQAGDYRQALAFCAHTAGAHLDSAAAGALYAWLLRAGGQELSARRALDVALAQAPQDPVVEATRRAFDNVTFFASGVLLDTPHRMAPYMLIDGAHNLSPGARMATGGVLIDGGRRALVPNAGIEGAKRVWVINGLGRAAEATVAPGFDRLRSQGIAVLQLSETLLVGDVLLAPRDPFAGSPGFVVGYGPATPATPAWPTIRQGFLGKLDGPDGLREVGIELPVGSGGGAAVLDAAGRVAGITMPGASGSMAMLPVSMFRELERTPTSASGPPRPPAPSVRIPMDQAYENGLKSALQVLIWP